jgi:release factor glutamine methyltransferase
VKTTEFINCKIDFSKKVFHPRIETEFWVKKAIGHLANFSMKKPHILDIFSGSGCIGIAVLKNIESSSVDFADIWPQSIEQIHLNLKLNRIEKNRYRVYESDLFEKLKNKKYDYIFANPPYVALNRIGEVGRDVLKNDPHQALFGGKDGMVLINRFFAEIKKHLKPGGKIFLELDPSQKKEISAMSKEKGFKVIFRKDQFDKIRWLEARMH